MNLFKGDIIILHRKDGTERIKAVVTKPYWGLSGYCEAREINGLGLFTREKLFLWKDAYSDWWIEVGEDDE